MSQLPFRILIIDDSPEDRETYRRFLSKGNEDEYEFMEADSVEDGWKLCESFHPDCVLLDYKLPGVDGLELLHRCEEQQPMRSFAVIMLTGHGDEQVAVEAMKTGAQDYLIKARITRDSLRKSVRHAIEKVLLQREHSQRQAELEKLAITDGLTSLLNRRYFLERLEQEVDRVQRYHSMLAVLMIDVDHFKNVNDTYGHLVGDHVLSQVGKALRSCLRSTDLGARYGGEEFCILAANTDLEGARAFAERIRQMVAEQDYAPPEHEPFHVTCSIGVAEATPTTPGMTELLALADQALYQAKHQGRNQVCAAGDSSRVLS